MAEKQFSAGGYIAPGIAKVVNNTGRPEIIVGKQIIAMFDNGTILGPNIIESVSFTTTDTEWGAEIITIPAARSLTMPVKFIPPKTRREKRQRKAFDRLFFGPRPPKPLKRRQLIHKGGKP
ncbi:hypothetical protein [Arthrobacter sp. EpRS71]|uniref:hypothetical protein n=1 Tax=Arthrobacter sp. EpRS71 TaxID=1743141 RepID=UPI00074A8532|nr:hypothetical protein [Arthrobacter sp. EpRS71]KUM34555.1 hypothetical protein AR689_10455 [Arthrobacter sp. EpRS71]